MAPSRASAPAQALHVVPIAEEPLPSQRHLRAVAARPLQNSSYGADVISIDSARRRPSVARGRAEVKDPAILAKWAFGLCLVMFVAALTSGQA